MLNDVLDVIWNGNADKTVLAKAAGMMSVSQIREAAMIHVAALLGMEPTEVSENKMIFQSTSAEVLRSSDGKGDIEYRDLRVGFVVQGIRIERNDGPTTMASLLDLFQYARDHGDTLLYLPADQRDEHIADIAKRCSSSERFARIVISRFRSLQSEIAE